MKKIIFSDEPLTVIKHRIKYSSFDIDLWYSGYRIPDETRDEVDNILTEYIKENIGRKTKDGVGLRGTVWHSVGNSHLYISKVLREDVRDLIMRVYEVVTKNMTKSV